MTKHIALRPSHPGETLREDFMEPLGLSAYAVAKALGCTQITVSLITRGKRAVTAEMALRLGRYTGTAAEFWLNLQALYDLDVARGSKGAEIARTVAPLERAA
jgi:addiction module HigA family antidote